MENHRRNICSSGDNFSFPAIKCHTEPTKELLYNTEQFEFGCLNTPGSPNSPADHLFFNGKLLPHVFPVQSGTSQINFFYTRSASGTSSRNSLISSRSNSMNSRSSSARTSTSEASERSRFSSSSSSVDGISSGRTSCRKDRNRPIPSSYQYGSSQRWQFIAAAPVIKHQGSRSRSRNVSVLERKGTKKSKEFEDEDSGKSVKSWFGRRILKSFVTACKECHAIKTSNVENVFTEKFGGVITN